VDSDVKYMQGFISWLCFSIGASKEARLDGGLAEDIPAHCRAIGLDDLYRFLPIQSILRFCSKEERHILPPPVQSLQGTYILGTAW